MQYDFTSLMDRHGKDAIAVDGVGGPGAPGAPKAGFDVIPMWVADMNFPTCPTIQQAIIARAQHPAFGYFDPTPEYYDSIIRWQGTRNGVQGLAKEHIGYENGVLGGVISALNCVCSRGDKVLLHSPTYIGFTHCLENNGYQIIHSPLVKDEANVWRMDFADMERRLKEEHIHAAILCNPHNPCGRVWEKWELEKAMELFRKYDVYVISDEIWSDIILGTNHHTPTQSVSDDARNRVCAFYAPSKTFNLAGLQSSTIVYDTVEHKDAYVAELKRMDIARNNCFSLVATMAAYEQGEEWLDQLLVYLSGNMRFIREFCAEHLPELKPNTPEATYLCWIDASALGMDDAALKKFCVEKAGVAFGEGNEFGLGGSGFLRLNAACPHSVIQKALTQLEAAVYNY